MVYVILVRTGIAILCGCGALLGCLADNWLITSTALVAGLCWIPIAAEARPTQKSNPTKDPRHRVAHQKTHRPTREQQDHPPEDAEALADDLIDNDRYALLLRPAIFSTLSERAQRRAVEALEDYMTPIARGHITLAKNAFSPQQELAFETFEVNGFYLDRYLVTNVEFQRFVATDGYRDSSLWPEETRAAMGSLVDKTGKQGPRFWRDGCFAEGEELLPVVGVCWYEAMAYAKWVGKRLPSDPEWSWAAINTEAITPYDPHRVSGSREPMGRYCWTADRVSRGLLPIDADYEGQADSGEERRDKVHQLVGNVWQWMHEDFGAWDDPQLRPHEEPDMKSLRGPAFDTYFDRSSPSWHLSADYKFARKRNIGFRCAITENDIATNLRKAPATALETE